MLGFTYVIIWCFDNSILLLENYLEKYCCRCTSHKNMLLLLFTCTRKVLSRNVLYLEHICGFFGDCDHNLLTLHYVTVCKSASKQDTGYAWIDCYFYCDGRELSYDLFFVVYLLNFFD